MLNIFSWEDLSGAPVRIIQNVHPSQQSEEQKQKGMIITDDFAKNPVLDFNAYADTIVDIIKDSEPNFTIGIYGEWGTGKTTLMRKIESKLKSEESITTVWFNAWRYEREEQFTLIPLLKKIAYSLPAADEFNGLRDSLKKGVGTIRRNLGQIVTSVVSDFVGKTIGINTADVVKDISNQLIPKIELLTEVNEKNTIYFDGLNKIEEEVKKIRVKGRPVRVVVFIDDLDRCQPKKALEVFESVKVFLGIDGFIYILGLSHETISKLITAEYGKSDIKGEQYIKKIIQIPISLPEWNTGDVSILIDDFVNSGFIVEKYVDIIMANKDLIAKATENNPREAKRFINNFIVAHEILLRYVQKVDAKEFLLVQAINVRWNKFYRLIVKLDEPSRQELKLYVEMSEEERSKELDTDAPPPPPSPPPRSRKAGVEVAGQTGSSKTRFNIKLRRLLLEFKNDLELWSFLKEHSQAIFGIKSWEIYRRGAESVREISPEPVPSENIPTIYEVRPKKMRLENQGNYITILGSNFGNNGTVWLDYYPPLTDAEEAIMHNTHIDAHEKDNDMFRYDPNRLEEEYDVTPRRELKAREENRIKVSLDDFKDNLKPGRRYVVRVERDGLFTYANSDATFEIVSIPSK